MDTDRFDYDLPASQIAQVPASPRDSARLLVDCGPDAQPQHRSVAVLPTVLQAGDLVVVNNTRVMPARLGLWRSSGGAVEVLLLEDLGERRWEALVRSSRRLRAGERLHLIRPDPGNLGEHRSNFAAQAVELVERGAGGRWKVAFGGEEPVAELLARHGSVPLPPYITTPLQDPERYQTVFAERAASAAAPTAGLHLSRAVLDGLAGKGIEVATVDLAVGLGTFRPITATRVEDHVMHEEEYRIPPATVAAVERADAVVAVGTTVVRTLETWARTGEVSGRSRLFIHRPYRFEVVDRLLTNFHVPRSSLLVMIDAFVGDRWRALYAEALARDYRFLSFGDAMLLTRPDGRRGGHTEPLCS
jgi:S-adenosylmethionine:tRNA ribosyltransferase-isomerase